LPPTCAYRLIGEGKPLFPWHPLLNKSSKSAMHVEQISVRYIAVREDDVEDWQDHIMNKPQWAK